MNDMTKPRLAFELTRDLLRYNTINPPGAERACAQHLGKMLEQAGFTIGYYEYADARTNLIARIGGSAGKKPLCFTGHIDIVPLGMKPWSKDPFAGETDAGKLYGRGSSDMKSGVAGFVVALINLADKLRNTPGVVLVITAGEETGCEGAAYLEKLNGPLGQAGAIVVAEPTGNYPLIGHKGAFWLRAKTRGKTAHGSMPHLGDNAVYKAARAVAKLERFEFGDAVHPALGKNSLNVGTFTGGLNINSVPDQAVIGIDMRTTPNQKHAEIRAKLEHHLGPEVELEVINDLPSVYTDPADPWIQSVFDITAPYLEKRAEPLTGPFFTDAAALRLAYGHPPCVILGPGESAQAHQTDEFCYADKIEQSVEYFTEITRRWCRL